MKKKYRLRKGRAAVFMLIIVVIAASICILKNGTKKQAETATVSSETPATTVPTSTTCITTSITTVKTTSTTKLTHISSPSCNAAALYCVDDKKLLYEDNINQRVAPASLTKLLTASVALKYVDKSKVFSVGSEQWLVQPDSSLCGIQNGNMLTLEDLITGMLMASGNDAAYTIAVSTAREINQNPYMTDYEAVQFFCRLMNDFAFSIGMKNSNFVNPDGWDDDEQYTTVSDLIKLTEYALSIPEIYEIAGTYSKSTTIFSGEFFTWENSNQLLNPYSDYFCESAKGMKTGTTLYAGYSLIAVFQNNEEIYISIVVGCQSDESRYKLTLELLSII